MASAYILMKVMIIMGMSAVCVKGEGGGRCVGGVGGGLIGIGMELVPCLEACTSLSLNVPRECCRVVSGIANMVPSSCLCSLLNSPLTRMLGIIPNIALTIPKRCGLSIALSPGITISHHIISILLLIAFHHFLPSSLCRILLQTLKTHTRPKYEASILQIKLNKAPLEEPLKYTAFLCLYMPAYLLTDITYSYVLHMYINVNILVYLWYININMDIFLNNILPS